MNATARRISLLGIIAGIVAFGPVVALAPAFDEKSKTEAVKLTPVKWQGYVDQVKAHQKSKLIVVDAWATWCGPCMKNFPHLVELQTKYADDGLVAISLSLDDADNPKKVAAATAFLKEKKATFTNLILDERNDDAFEKLNIGTIPAVFIYTPDGKEIKRFTLDDVDKLFTYEEVEAFVKDYFKGKAGK